MANAHRHDGARASAGDLGFDAIIIGAGFSGLYQLYSLRERLQLSVRVLERAADVGGTWYWNRYPGARCDSESYSYSFSFSEHLEQEWNWSERYPAQPEIMRYLRHVAERFDLRRDIDFNTEVVSARFDEGRGRWLVTTACDRVFSATYLITAVGCLSATNVPTIDGLEDFRGQWYHTGNWPPAGVDFHGRRVGQIGTGSTGIQAAPVIAAQAAHLYVFQRTPNFSIPARNAPLAPQAQAEIKQNYAEIRRIMRQSTNGHPFLLSPQSALEVTPEERRARYEAAWQHGGLRFRATFRDLLTDRRANDTAADFIREKIRDIVVDPAIAERLMPRDHPFAAKRPPIDTDYFETFNRDNVTLVDLRTLPIERITPSGIKTAGAEYPLDIIVFATGFDAMTGPLLGFDLRGRGGRALRDVWAVGPKTYLGLQIAGFPNLFTITGPGSPSVLCNMPVPIEQHVEWITDCIGFMRAHDLAFIEATEDAMARWGTEVAAAAATLLPEAASSWYLGANVPGKPRVFMPYPGGMAHYRGLCDQVAANAYAGFRLSAG